jgi:hypothetical protein
MDYESPKIRIIENFIDDETCKKLIDHTKDTDLWSINNDISANLPNPDHKEEYSKQWDNRVISLNRVANMKIYPELLKATWDIKEKSKLQVMDFFKKTDDIFLESWEIVRWYYPIEQGPHIDFIELDFNHETDVPKGYNKEYYPSSPEAAWVWKNYNTRKHYTSMLYLNEDYEGGELYFPMHNDFTIKPKTGMLAIFSGDINHPHGVKQITNGTRYVNTAFWCRDAILNGATRHTIDSFEKYWE